MLHLLRISNVDSTNEKVSGCTDQQLGQFLPESNSSVELSTGRSAIAYLIEKMGLTANDTVMLPSYVAEGVVRPFQLLGINVDFYRLTPKLQPSLDDLSRLIGESSRARLIVVIHFFGFKASIEPIRELIGTRDISILEDCAHALFGDYSPGKAFGTTGDFSLFSLNKFLPVPDGAILLSNNKKINLKERPLEFFIEDTDATNAYLTHLKKNELLYHSNDPKESTRLIEESGRAYDLYYDKINTNLSFRAPSKNTREILKNLNFKELIHLRKRNVQFLYENFSSKSIQLLNKDYSPDAVYFAIPVLAKNCQERNQIFKTFLQKGLFASTLIERWNFIPKQKEPKYENEIDFMNRHLLLPINEFLSLEDMKKIVSLLKQI